MPQALRCSSLVPPGFVVESAYFEADRTVIAVRASERLQYEGYLRREETNAAILALSKSGTTIKQIVRQTGYSRKLVRQVIRGERHDVFRTRQSSLDQHLPWLDEQWAAGGRNGAELWRRLRTRGSRSLSDLLDRRAIVGAAPRLCECVPRQSWVRSTFLHESGNVASPAPP